MHSQAEQVSAVGHSQSHTLDCNREVQAQQPGLQAAVTARTTPAAQGKVPAQAWAEEASTQ